MKNPLPLFLCLPLTLLPAADAGTLIISVLDSGDLDPGANYDLDTLGSLDWKLFSTSSGVDFAKSGGSGIGSLTVPAGSDSTNSGASPRFTWTTGTAPNASGTNEDPGFYGTPQGETTGEQFAISAAATSSLQTLYIFAGVNRAYATLNASLSDGSAMAVSHDFNPSGVFDHITYKIDFSADAASGETLDLTWTKTNDRNNDASFLKFQGAALTVPEPSTGLLCAAGLGLVVFRRKR